MPLVNKIQLYSFVTKGGSEGEGDGQFLHPHVPANDAQGKLFVTNRELANVQVFTNNGNYYEVGY